MNNKTQTAQAILEKQLQTIQDLAKKNHGADDDQCAQLRAIIISYHKKAKDEKKLKMYEKMFNSIKSNLESPKTTPEQLSGWINKMSKRYEIDSALEDIANKAWGYSMKQLFINDFRAMRCCYNGLKDATEAFFKINGATTKNQYGTECYNVLHTDPGDHISIESHLEDPRGLTLFVGAFIALIGIALDIEKCKKVGMKILSSETDATKKVNKFKEAFRSLNDDNAPKADKPNIKR